MRLAILGLLLCAGTALCQSNAPSPANPDSLWQTPLVVTPPARDFSKLPPGWHASAVVPPRILIQPGILWRPKAENKGRLDDPGIDPKIIVHPPQKSLGVNPPGTPIAQNEYPHLQMLPIEVAKPTPER
jgi:hypothetical protein